MIYIDAESNCQLAATPKPNALIMYNKKYKFRFQRSSGVSALLLQSIFLIFVCFHF